MLIGPTFVPKETKNALILFHGYGADGDDLFSLTDQLKIHFKNMAFFMPNAPYPTPHFGYEWFSLNDYFEKNNLDIQYLNELKERATKTIPIVEKYIQDISQNLHLSKQNIFIGGFSQGGLIAAQTAFNSNEPYAGLILMSPVPFINIPESALKLPVLLTRGLEDNVIPLQAAELTKPALDNADFCTTESIDPFLGHGISQTHLNCLIEFIKTNIQD